MLIKRGSMLIAAGAVALLVACGGSGDGGWNAQGIADSQYSAPFVAILAIGWD